MLRSPCGRPAVSLERPAGPGLPAVRPSALGNTGRNGQAGAMNMDQRIVVGVGVDGSGFSTAALRHAERMATSLNAQMLVVGRLGQGGFPGRARGSVSGAGAAHAHCLVLGQDKEAQRAPQGIG
jgi:hypothetical protein